MFALGVSRMSEQQTAGCNRSQQAAGSWLKDGVMSAYDPEAVIRATPRLAHDGPHPHLAPSGGQL
jgi:hypothetical protein